MKKSLIGFLVILSLTFSKSLFGYNYSTDYLNHNAYYYAMKAYKSVREQRTVSPYLIIVDFTLPDTQKRFFIIDTRTNQIIDQEYVAHGKNSGDVYVHWLSNKVGSKMSSEGVMITGTPYYGHAGLSLHVHGLDNGFNNNVYNRHMVIHGARYVGQSFLNKYGYLGHSWGCFSLDYKVSTNIINLIKNGTIIFAYYNDPHYLNNSKWLE